jgi:precorrin-6B methylase 2
MSTSTLEHLFSFLQTIVFKQIGNKMPTNALKGVMDIAFIVFEKVGCKFEIISSIYLKLYHDIVLKELSMACLTKDDRVLVIGSGSLPATPALIAQNAQVTIVSIDKDRTAVKNAVSYVKNHHLDSRLTIEYADVLQYSVERFTVVFVLYGVKRPQEVLVYLASHIHENTRVIFRAITDAQGKFEDQTIDILKHFSIKEKVHSETLGSFDSFLLMKK